MDNWVEILKSGIVTIQDSGRRGYENLGVPTSGAWDLATYRRLTGLLECPDGPMFESLAGDLQVCFAGPAVWAWAGPGICLAGGIETPSNLVNYTKGEVSIARTGPGPIYLAAPGLCVPLTLGSASTDTHSGIGPLRPQAGDRFELTSINWVSTRHAVVGNFARPATRSKGPLRILAHERELGDWLAVNRWRATSISRTGIKYARVTRDNFSSLHPAVSRTRVSHPVLPGVIQIPSQDEIIILGPDCGTTGGYTTAGAVVEVDLGNLAYLEIGSETRFEQTTMECAADLSKNSDANLYKNISELSTSAGSALYV